MINSLSKAITIDNCNCINHAELTVVPKQLNIKFGVNGIGKSTIGKAIATISADNQKAALGELLPYGADIQNRFPSISGLDNDTKVKVFNAQYANQFIIEGGTGDTLFENSFQVFLRSSDCEELMIEINKQLDALQKAFVNQPDFNEIFEMLSKIQDVIKMKGETVSRAGGLGEVIKGNGYGFEKHANLKPYEAYYKAKDFTTVVEWAKWRRAGNKKLNDSNICPFCANTFDRTIINEQNESIETVFKNSALTVANNLITLFDGIEEKDIAKADSIDRIRHNLGDKSKSEELVADLSELATETKYLIDKINNIRQFRPVNIGRAKIKGLDKILKSLTIDESYLKDFYRTERVLNTVNNINEQINELLKQTAELKELFAKYDCKLSKLVQERKDDINGFFILAGFPYEFCIDVDQDQEAVTYLRPTSESISKVTSLSKHLSWGEMNAFSLVMFMFEAFSENDDLVILDDPISAFDANKKFAIIQRLFNHNEKVNLLDKTVIMFTHDSQPLLDFVRVKPSPTFRMPIEINATYLQNDNGCVTEIKIMPNDLRSIIELTRDLSSDHNASIACRVVNLRKYIECCTANSNSSSAYQILSNLIHGRKTATEKDGTTVLPEKVFQDGCSEILSTYKITDFSYDKWLEKLSPKQLQRNFDNMAKNNEEKYNKVITARLLLERKEGGLTQLCRTSPGLYKYINETNHIENDYIFQLDPRKYYCIPQDYEKELNKYMYDLLKVTPQSD
jgi:ABC-type cobalamin/Fe3+-siderophores transport system ATPase subunit